MNLQSLTFSGGIFDAFVAKIDPTGTLLYCTYLGGDGEESSNAIAVDGFGNAYVTGRTNSSNFPMVNPLQPIFAGGVYDAYVAKLSSTGSSLIYSTYLGGTDTEDSFGIKVDGAQTIYVSGQTLSTNFPTTAGAFQTTNHGSADIYVTKIDASGTTIDYSTLVGGVAREMDGRLAIDNLGNAYLTGQTDSPDFPVVNAFQNSKAAGLDAFIFKLNSTGTALVYSTYSEDSLMIKVRILQSIHPAKPMSQGIQTRLISL
jgi:hypothetical protein